MNEAKEKELNDAKVDVVMGAIEPRHRYRWCDSGACACLGCVNNKLWRAGVTRYEWESWCQRNPPGSDASPWFKNFKGAKNDA